MARILVVDDADSIRVLISELLKLSGHSVVTAGNGEEAIATLGHEHFDLVITDILMPESDGIEVMTYLNGLPRRPRIIAISGGGTAVTANFALQLARLQADSVMLKPFRNADLRNLVTSILASPHHAGAEGKA